MFKGALQLLLVQINLSAQISVSFFQKNHFEFNINECSDFSLINSSNSETVDVEFEISGKNGSLVKGVFKQLVCPRGSTSYKGSLGQEFSFSNQALNSGINLTKRLNAGEYQLCYLVLKVGTREELANPCFDIQVLSMSPPLLIFPSNNGIVNTLNPNLIWQGPLIAGGRSTDFRYDLKISEMLENQEPFDALNQNFAIYKAEGLSLVQLLYPFQASKLSNGKSYAWQIVAKNNSGYTAETEIWKFTVQLDTFKAPDVVFFEGFLIPTKNENEGILNIRHALKLSFSEAFPLTKMNFTILDEKKQEHCTLDSAQVEVLDFNKFNIQLDHLSVPLKNKQVYFLRVDNLNTSENYLVKFKYFKN